MIRKTPSDKKAVVHKNKTKTAEIALNHVTRSLSTHNEEENLASLLGAGDDDVDKQEMGAEMNKSIELSKQDSTTKRKSKLAALDSAINVKDNWDNVNLFYYYQQPLLFLAIQKATLRSRPACVAGKKEFR